VQYNVDIAEIRRRVRASAYLVKRDAILHAVKEGFLQQDEETIWERPPFRRRKGK
jgi:hypothetical protein